MNKIVNLCLFPALYCTAILGAGETASANDVVSTDKHIATNQNELAHSLTSKCRRNGVVWSGGVASRFSDRISPRPVRSRWDRDSDNRIQCKDIDAFKKLRVSDQPLIR